GPDSIFMKEPSTFSAEQIEALTKDAGVLKNEAEALQHVIEEIPYDQSPPDGHSVTQILRLLDYAHLNYYHPVLEEGEKNTSAIHVEEHTSFEKTFETDTEEETDVQQLLKKIAKHRKQIITTIKSISNWEAIVYVDDKEYTLYQFARKMIKF